jgi:HEAT repeat protein
MSNGSISQQLAALFDAERAARRIQAEVLRAHARGAGDATALVTALAREVEAARALKDTEEQALRLVRIASLAGELQGGPAIDLLIDLLGDEEPEARHAAGEALEGLAYERFKEVALGVERALDRLPAGSSALSELPYLIAEIPEPGAAKLLGRFLRHSDPEAVAAAIEALVEVGDPSVVALLAPLEKDTRAVQLEDEEGEDGKVTIGELASEARALLGEIEGARTSPSQSGRPRP